MNSLVGHIIRKSAEDRWGYTGSFYNYLLAGNGVFVEAQNNLLEARAQIAEAEVRGLKPLEELLELRHGHVPSSVGMEILGRLLHSPVELYLAVLWEGYAYRLLEPVQEQGAAHVKYQRPSGKVLFEIHSHPGMSAFFSSTDTHDEQGLAIYGVMGDREGRPAVQLRLGVYGYFMPLRWEQVFTEPLPEGFTDMGKEDAYVPGQQYDAP